MVTLRVISLPAIRRLEDNGHKRAHVSHLYWPCPKVKWLEVSHMATSNDRRDWEMKSRCVNKKEDKTPEPGSQLAMSTIKKYACSFF